VLTSPGRTEYQDRLPLTILLNDRKQLLVQL
jgi:hypothetical protein